MGAGKKECCRSKPKRCADCPVVVRRVRRLRRSGLTGKALRRAVKAARIF